MKKAALFILMLCMGQVLTLKAQNTDVSEMENVVYIIPCSVAPGTTKVNLPINMKNTVEIRGLQFDLYLPDGATIEFNKKGKFVDEPVFNADRLPEDDEHTIQGAVQENGSIRFLINSQYEETFTGNDGVLFTVAVNLPADMTEGDYPIIMKDIKLSESDINKSYTTDSIKSTLTVSSVAAIKGISVIDADRNIYNLRGQEVDVTMDGIIIIEGKKMLVK